MSEPTVSENAIVIERVFDASMELIWNMWTDPKHFQNWYGPTGFTLPVAEIDLQVGGKHLFCMQSPDGNMQMWSTGEYIEITPHTRLIYSESMCDSDGNILDPAQMGMPEDYPVTTQITIELSDDSGKTKMTMTHAGVPSNQGGATGGWNQAFAKLDEYITTL